MDGNIERGPKKNSIFFILGRHTLSKTTPQTFKEYSKIRLVYNISALDEKECQCVVVL